MQPIHADNATPVARIVEAVDRLRAGEAIALPTDTVYGLACDPRSDAAVAAIYEAKGRPTHSPLPVLLPDAEAVHEWALDPPPLARHLAGAFWPGPLTLVLAALEGLPRRLLAGRATIALRVPSHPTCLAVLRAWGGGLAVTSANRHGAPSPRSGAEARAQLPDTWVLDAGECPGGVESTIVDLTSPQPRVLRAGAIEPEALAPWLTLA